METKSILNAVLRILIWWRLPDIIS